MKSWKVALIAAAAVVLVTAVGTIVMAQTRACRQRGGMMGMAAHALNLTPEQQAKGKEIFKSALAEAKGVLTPEQQAQVAQMHTGMRRGKRGQGRRNLQLTAEQKTKMKAIVVAAKAKGKAIKENANLSDADRQAQLRDLHQATREQMRQVLTPEQQAKMGSLRQRGGQFLQKLNLTQEQKTKLLAIAEKDADQFRATLTPDQQQKFDGYRTKIEQHIKQWQGEKTAK